MQLTRLSEQHINQMQGRSERFQLMGEVEEDPFAPDEAPQDIGNLLDVKLLIKTKAIEDGDEKVWRDS
jgi:hypothetical protein